MTAPRASRAAADLARHDRVTSALHWLIGLALLAQIAFGFGLDTLSPRGAPSRALVIDLHQSTGLLLGLLVVLRLGWRLRHSPPPWPAGMAAWQRRAATLGHRALYASMLLMPASGYVASNFSRHGVRFFGGSLVPWGPDWPSAHAALNLLHVVAAWVFAALILGHVAVALQHALVRRDGLFLRILPWRQRAPLLRSTRPPDAARKTA